MSANSAGFGPLLGRTINGPARSIGAPTSRPSSTSAGQSSVWTSLASDGEMWFSTPVCETLADELGSVPRAENSLPRTLSGHLVVAIGNADRGRAHTCLQGGTSETLRS